ncbi:MAG: hypothetical protein CO139_00015 [Candidatus Moranbacteria bacterium CG_4_9_14_3_um_filter_36_9]|nr:MAG: hypothetical protein CO139_00015 [Candidatus Moranbacteria bacterium CG_4_9_14_3_um_filter_36_9]
MSNLKYEKIYSKNKAFFGKGPSLLIFKNNHLFTKNSLFLDLGCGQGKDLLFMNELGHRCLGIDASAVATEQLKNIITKKSLKNIRVRNDNIVNFNFSKKYNVINIQNILQYLEKKEAGKILQDIKENTSDGGFVIISALTIEDPSYLVKSGFKNYFKKNELLKIFTPKFNIRYYFEGLVQDGPHGDYPPHQHGLVMLIARKK